MNDAEPVFFIKSGDKFRQSFIGNPALQLAVDGIYCGLPERVAINLLNGFSEDGCVKKLAFNVLSLVSG